VSSHYRCGLINEKKAVFPFDGKPIGDRPFFFKAKDIPVLYSRGKPAMQVFVLEWLHGKLLIMDIRYI